MITFIILFSNFMFIKPTISNAAGVSGSSALKALVTSSLEKGGLKFGNEKAREKAYQAWDLKRYKKWEDDEKNGRNADLWKEFETIRTNPPKPEPIPDKPGFGRILLDASIYGMAFGFGLDIGTGIYNEFINDLDNPTYDAMAENMANTIDKNAVTSIFGISFVQVPDKSTSLDRYQFLTPNGLEYEIIMRKGYPYYFDITNFYLDNNTLTLVYDLSLYDYYRNLVNYNGSKVTFEEGSYSTTNESVEYNYKIYEDDIPEIEIRKSFTDFSDYINNSDESSDDLVKKYSEVLDPTKPIELIVPIGDNPFVDNPYNDTDPSEDVDPSEDTDPSEIPDSTLTPDTSGFWGPLWNWLKKIWESIISLPKLIVDGIGNLFIPTRDISEIFGDTIKNGKDRFLLPSDFDWLNLETISNSCPKDIKWNDMKIVDMAFICEYSEWWKPIMSGFMWFLFGWWLYRKVIQTVHGNGGQIN